MTVVGGVRFEAAVQDADETVAELTEGCVVADVAVSECVVGLLADTSRWSHAPVNEVVPYRWQATQQVCNSDPVSTQERT